MLRRARCHLSYANVMATIAVFLALGGGAYAVTAVPRNSVTSRAIKNGQVKRPDLGRAAVTNSKLARNSVSTSKIRDNAVSTPKIADGSVTTGKLGTDAVTSDKLAANSVSGLKQIQNDSVTGQDIIENTLTFGCSPLNPTGTTTYQIANGGFCAFVIHPATSRTWSQAATDCNGTIPDSTLANPAQIAQLQATNGGSQGPVTGTTGIWTPNPSGTFSVWTVTVGNGGTVDTFTSTTIASTSSGPIVCVFEPASKNG